MTVKVLESANYFEHLAQPECNSNAGENLFQLNAIFSYCTIYLDIKI